MAIEIVDLPIKHGDFPYVKLPEGKKKHRPMRLEKLDSSSIVMGIPLLNPITTGWGPQDS